MGRLELRPVPEIEPGMNERATFVAGRSINDLESGQYRKSPLVSQWVVGSVSSELGSSARTLGHEEVI